MRRGALDADVERGRLSEKATPSRGHARNAVLGGQRRYRSERSGGAVGSRLQPARAIADIAATAE